MGYKCSFMDNEVYTAQDVNEAIGRIAGDGAAFSDTGDTLSDLNTALAGIVGSGAQLCGCEVTKTDNVYKIGAGTCFMEDGSQITFDSDGYEFTPEEGVKNYVYVKRNAANNTIDTVVSQTAGSGDFVPLAEIAADGSVSDTRKFATAKVMLKSGQSIPTRTFNVHGESGWSKKSWEINVGYSDWKYIILKFPEVILKSAVDLSDEKEHDLLYCDQLARKDGNKIIIRKESISPVNLTFELR